MLTTSSRVEGWKKRCLLLEISSLHVQFSTEKINETIETFLHCYCTFWNSLVKSSRGKHKKGDHLLLCPKNWLDFPKMKIVCAW